MPLFYNEKTILYLTGSSIDLYDDKNIEGARLEIPKDSLDHLEVVNPEKLRALLHEFFAKFQLGGKAGVLVLSDGVTFRKDLPAEDEPEEKNSEEEEEEGETAASSGGKQRDKFFEDIPIDPEKLVKREIRLDGGKLLIAANRELFMLIVKQLDSIGFKVESVVPAFLFEVDPHQPGLDLDDIKRLVKRKELWREADLLDSAEGRSERRGSAAKKGSVLTRQFSEWLFAPVLVILLVGLLLIFWFKFASPEDLHSVLGLQDNPANLTAAAPSITSQAVLEPTSSASALPRIAKGELRLEVLNGTGTSGLAKNEADKLSALGYTSVDIGNAPESNQNQTTITLDDKVTAEEKDEIVSLVKKDLDPVVVKSATDQGNYDIIITTGPQSR